MALIMGIPKYRDFFVEDTKVKVVAIEDELHYTLECKGKQYQIDDERSVEILPNVFVSAGKKGGEDVARLAIRAPRHISIERGNVYRRKRREGDPGEVQNIG